MWHSVCWRLFGKGFRAEDVAEFLDPYAKDYPEGFAAKFVGRVAEEVQRSFEKFREREERRGAGPRTDESTDAAPQPGWLPNWFWVKGSAIYTEVDTKDEVLTIRVCSVFKFIGVAADDTTSEQALIIDVPDKLNPQRNHQVLIPRAHLADSGLLYRANSSCTAWKFQATGWRERSSTSFSMLCSERATYASLLRRAGPRTASSPGTR